MGDAHRAHPEHRPLPPRQKNAHAACYRRIRCVRYDVFDEPHMEDRMIQEQIHQDVRDLLETLPTEQQLVVKMRIERDRASKRLPTKRASPSTPHWPHALRAD